ncbi:MAG: von Willebrand factor type A domain-containing protein [Lewinella sp.]
MRPLLLLLFSLPLLLAAQSGPITGQVVDAETDDPLVGVNVLLAATPIGTVTDIAGRFSITAASESGKLRLVFSYVGYETRTINASPGDSLGRISLQPAEDKLKEVIVMGYSQRRKHDAMGSLNNQYYSAPAAPYDYGRPEQYNSIEENGWVQTNKQAISTLSTDVDRASYANVRRFIEEGSLPPADAVRSEEMINYFNYDDPAPTGDEPLALYTETGACPWNPENQILRVAIRAKDISRDDLPAANLVFLLDVSGSMQGPDRLDLLKKSMLLLVDQLRPQDRISIVVYAGAAGLVLPPTPGDQGSVIRDAISELSAGGSTAGGAGIKLAYATAEEHFIPGGNNRIILATDGDFNVGTSSQNALVDLIEQKRTSGVYLTVLGFGRGNYQGGTMQELADRGNGNHAYIDGLLEAKKTLIEEFGGTLVTVAKDVKVQLAFDPKAVAAYRLIGYENRLLNAEDFDDDTKDAGEIGAGHRVTVLYEIIPGTARSEELAELRIRYKAPEGGYSRELTTKVNATETSASDNLNWAAAVAEFAMLLRESEHRGAANYPDCMTRARAARGEDPNGYRGEMIGLMERAAGLAKK